jgi:hypothetical protein
LHWRLTRPAQGQEQLAKLKQARDFAARLVGGDPSNKPVCHPIRWPGSWHRKNKSSPRLCEFDPWAQYVVPEFPLKVFPIRVGEYVCAQSMVIGCDPSALAMAVLTAFSSAIDHRCAVKMMRNGNWWEHPRLWTLLVGRPVAQENAHHQRGNPSTRTTPRCLANRLRGATTRLRGGDTTTEKLGEILSRSDRGLLVKRDEFSGWIGAMEKYGGGGSRGASADRGFWLQAFDGGPYTIDRINRGETYIRNLSVSLLGGVQPARLAELQGLTSDGLLQRFIPVIMGPSKLPLDRVCDDEHYIRLMHKLMTMSSQRFTFDDNALAIMTELRAYLHDLEEASGGLADGFQGFVGKLSGLAGSLALILHIVRNVEMDVAIGDIDAITHHPSAPRCRTSSCRTPSNSTGARKV